jgi:hypothetical protein
MILLERFFSCMRIHIIRTSYDYLYFDRARFYSALIPIHSGLERNVHTVSLG